MRQRLLPRSRLGSKEAELQPWVIPSAENGKHCTEEAILRSAERPNDC